MAKGPVAGATAGEGALTGIQIIDANVILRWLLNDHPELSPRAAEFWDAVRGGECKAFVPEAVLAECVYVLIKSIKVPRAEVSEVLQKLISMRGVTVGNRKAVLSALKLFGESNLSFVDTLVAAHAVSSGAAIMSFDQELLKVARRMHSPKDPD